MYYYRPYYPGYYYPPTYDYDYDLYNSQYSTIDQSIYNSGYMAGVTQTAYNNQVMYDRNYWRW